MTSALLRVSSSDPEYLELARAEAEYWNRTLVGSIESLENLQSDGPIERYQNTRFTGEAKTPWQDTIHRHGVFRRGLVLGTSGLSLEGRILQTNPALHLTFLDISPDGLARRRDMLGARYPGRVATLCADLNFLDLERASYDLIVSAASLHHVTNLEYVAARINDALTPGGYFFLQDYVGEPRFQFCPAKKRIFEYLHDVETLRSTRRPGLDWMDASDLSPFCGVRSDEVLRVLGEYLDPVHVRTAGALTVPLMRVRPLHGEKPGRPSLARRLKLGLMARLYALRGLPPPADPPLPRHYMRQLMEIGDLLSDAGVFPPGTAFGTYRKRA